VRLKDLITGKTLEKTFKSGESVEGADVMELNMQYLYSDGDTYNFMDPESFDQYVVDETGMGAFSPMLINNGTCTTTPVFIVAGLPPVPAVSPFSPGSVSATSSIT
jgi:elongation factor P